MKGRCTARYAVRTECIDEMNAYEVIKGHDHMITTLKEIT